MKYREAVRLILRFAKHAPKWAVVLAATILAVCAGVEEWFRSWFGWIWGG